MKRFPKEYSLCLCLLLLHFFVFFGEHTISGVRKSCDIVILFNEYSLHGFVLLFFNLVKVSIEISQNNFRFFHSIYFEMKKKNDCVETFRSSLRIHSFLHFPLFPEDMRQAENFHFLFLFSFCMFSFKDASTIAYFMSIKARLLLKTTKHIILCFI